MIQINIKNAQEIVSERKGKAAALLGSFTGDIKKKVEEKIVEEIKKVFIEEGVEADIDII